MYYGEPSSDRKAMALNYANDSIPGDHPAVAYATVYPVCMFLRVIIIQILIMCFI